MPTTDQALDTVSNEMDEIIGKIPPWIIRWGITVLFLVAIIALVISSYVRFPDSIQGSVVIQAKEQPGKVTVRRESANQAYRFLVKDKDRVQPGDTLLIRIDKIAHQETPITTPMAGTIYRVSGNSQENALEETIWVVPDATTVDVKIKYHNKGAGNVKAGQEVRIALQDYPDHEYGFLEGRIESILPIQTENSHQAHVLLNNKTLRTSTGKELPILPSMQGDGEILLNSRSIFQRIFNSLLH